MRRLLRFLTHWFRKGAEAGELLGDSHAFALKVKGYLDRERQTPEVRNLRTELDDLIQRYDDFIT